MHIFALTALAVLAFTFGALTPGASWGQGSVSSSMDHDDMNAGKMAKEIVEEAMDNTAMNQMDQGDMKQNDITTMDHSTMNEMDGMDDQAPMAHDHEKILEEAAALAEEDGKEVGIEERLGSLLAEAEFTDSEGSKIILRDLIDAPTILLPIYFKCPDVCNLLQSNFSQILPEVKLEPGKELQIISLSFDPRDQTKDAANAKRQYIAALQGGFPAEHWTFLTGDQAAIDAALNSIGYTVRKQGGLYAHPVAVVSVAPGGKVVRYLYGPGFLPMDVTIAATKAAQGIEALSVKRLLSMCYSYDPEGRRYVFSTLRVAGFSIMTFVVVFFAFLMLGGKKKTARRRKKASK